LATAEQILACRIELADTDVSLPFLSDTEYSYFIDKNNGSVARASVDCAKTILFKLSYSFGDEISDILQLKNRSARAYKEALMLYLRNPDLNPIYKTVNPYAGGISKSDIATNLADPDQNTVTLPTETKGTYTNDNPFVI